jgi:hypothetical protein
MILGSLLLQYFIYYLYFSNIMLLRKQYAHLSIVWQPDNAFSDPKSAVRKILAFSQPVVPIACIFLSNDGLSFC